MFDERIDNYVRRQASKWRIEGYEAEDIYQEARLAAWRAIRPDGPFDRSKGSLGSYVHDAVRGHLHNAARTAHAAKRRGSPASLDADIKNLSHGDQLTLFDIVADPRASVADIVELRADIAALVDTIAGLPPKQRAAHDRYVNDEPTTRLDQRNASFARRKLRNALRENAA